MNVNFNLLLGNPAVLKQVNMVRVLNRLRIKGSISRAGLARATGLDTKTITNICNSLFAEGLIKAREATVSGRGRPAEAISIQEDAAFAFGVDIGATQISVVLINLTGHIEHKKRVEFGRCRDAAFLLHQAGNILKEMYVNLPKDKRNKVRGIGVCVPGFLDRSRRIVIDSVNIENSKGLKIRGIIDKSMALPVFLEEASRSMAIAELWFGHRSGCLDFICIDMGFGVGTGIVHNGLLYRGVHESGGEIGHMTVAPGGAKCSCGKRGCLETIVSGHALHKAARKLKSASTANSYGGRALYDAAVTGNHKAVTELAKAGYSIGVAIANTINLFDPSVIILNGGLIKAGDFVLEPLKSAVKEHSIGRMTSRCDIEISNLGEFAGALGAAMLPLKHYFEFENIRF